MARDDLPPRLRGATRSAETRRAESAEGLAFARAWRRSREAPTAAGWDYPFAHRTCAEWR